MGHRWRGSAAGEVVTPSPQMGGEGGHTMRRPRGQAPVLLGRAPQDGRAWGRHHALSQPYPKHSPALPPYSIAFLPSPSASPCLLLNQSAHPYHERTWYYHCTMTSIVQ